MFYKKVPKEEKEVQSSRKKDSFGCKLKSGILFVYLPFECVFESIVRSEEVKERFAKVAQTD